MEPDVILSKHKKPILIKYDNIFDEDLSMLLKSSLLFKKEFEWNTYTIEPVNKNQVNKNQVNKNQVNKNQVNKKIVIPTKKSEDNGSKSDDSSSDDAFNESSSDESHSDEPNVSKQYDMEKYDTEYELLSFSDTVWYSRRYYGCVIETHLIKKHNDIFGAINHKIHNVIENLCENNWSNNLKYPSYWLCFHYRDGHDELRSLSNIIRFYNKLDSDPIIMISFGEDRNLEYDGCDSDQNQNRGISMNEGSVFIIFSPFKDYNPGIRKNKDCRRQHLSLIGFYNGFS